MAMQNSRFEFESDDRLRDAFRIIERLDAQRNLSTGAVAFFFVLSAGAGVYAFFLLLDAVLWQGINDFVASLVVAVSWVLIFPVWLMTFVGILSLLHSRGITDLKAEARTRLSDLALEPGDLRKIQHVLGSHALRHERLFRTVVAELLADERAGRHG